MDNQNDTVLPPTIKKDSNDTNMQNNILEPNHLQTEHYNENIGVNLTHMSENQLTPTRTDILQENSIFSHEYNSEDMIQLSQLSPINTSRVTQYTYNNNDNINHNITTSASTTSIQTSSDDSNSIQPRNLNNIFPTDRETNQHDFNNSTKGNLETQGPGNNT
jgi:hypothetical protein